MVLLTALIVLLASLCVDQPAARGDEPADLASRRGEDWGHFWGRRVTAAAAWRR